MKLRTFSDNPLPATDRRVWILAFAILVVCLCVGSCIDKEVSEVGATERRDPAGGDPYVLAGYEIENPHFEIPTLVGPVPSKTYWIKKGDEVAAVFDTFEFHWQRKGKMCDFLDNTAFSPNGADCAVCEYCTDGNAPSCFGTVFGGGGGIVPGFLEVIKYAGFTPVATKANAYSFAEFGGIHKVIAACPNQSQARMTFKPDTSGLYQLTSDAGIALRGGTGGTVKLFILDDGNNNPTTIYPLTSDSDSEGVQLPDPCATPSPTPTPSPNSRCPGCAWFKLPAPTTEEGFRPESFSPNLRITDVRVLKGMPSVDPITGRFKLDVPTTEYTHPSRIILFPAGSDGESALDHDRVRCYTDSSIHGNINLTACREDVNAPGTNYVLGATPQYIHTSATEGLIWFVEFNPAEHGVIPTLNCGEVLAIQFTLERLP